MNSQWSGLSIEAWTVSLRRKEKTKVIVYRCVIFQSQRIIKLDLTNSKDGKKWMMFFLESGAGLSNVGLVNNMKR